MQWFFEHFPFLEVWVRIIYKKALELGILRSRIVPNEKAETVEKENIDEVKKILEANGFKKGDVLIVHSSMKGIRGFGLSPEEVICYLKKLTGDDGMLFMPAYPVYPDTDDALHYDEKYSGIYKYDVENTPAWTGLITNIFCKDQDVFRSRYPNNTLAAWGKERQEPFKGELDTDLAYDRNSAWRYCTDRHAKVLFLGIHAHHSLSEIHIAEDYLDKKLPVTGWYTKKKYQIILNGKTEEKICRVRKKFWTRYMTEYYGCYRLRKEGMLKEGKIGNINYSVIPDLYFFEKYVEECASKGDFLYFRIPRRYRKKI